MKMRQTMFQLVLSMLICGLSVTHSHAAGQVVTQEIRDWAKKTIENEKTLAGARDKNTMVILYFLNQTNRKELTPLEKGMTLMLLTDLSQVPGLQLIERVKLQALAEELKLGSSGLVDQQTAPRVGKLVGASWIVGGDFIGGGEMTFDTKSRLLDVASSKISSQFSVPGTLDDFLKTEKELAFMIVNKLKISLKPGVAAAIRKPCTTNMKALDALFRGVDASDRAEHQQAGELYTAALVIDPDVCVANEALKELVQMGLYSNPAALAASSAVAETAQSVHGQTSLTNQIVPKEATKSNNSNPAAQTGNGTVRW